MDIVEKTDKLFDNNSKCPACECEEVSVRYCQKGPQYMIIGGDCKHDKPRLHRVCQRCNYMWLEVPLNEDK